MRAMDLDIQPVEQVHSAPAGRRYSVLVVALAAALGLATGLLVGIGRPHTQPPQKTVEVYVGLSTYPAPVTAAWWGRDGKRATLDPWIGKSIRITAVRVVIAVAYADGPVQCTLKIDGEIEDTQSANTAGEVAVCSWTA
jgi:hypothetical protein